MEKQYLALDIGGSAIKYGVVYGGFHIERRGNVPTPRDSMESLLTAMRHIYGETGMDTRGVGISFTATMDAATGFCFGGSLEHFTKGINLTEVLRQAFPVPVAVENDGNCAALAEATYGSLKDCGDAVMLVLGTGVGGGLIHDHKILRGKSSCSGEFSYVITDYSSGRNFAAFNGSRALTEPLAAIKGETGMDGRRFFEYAGLGDADALRILDEFTRHLAVQIYNIQAIYAPERFAIGGGISQNPLLMQCLERNLDALYAKNTTLPRAAVSLGTFMNDANLIGAVCYLQSVHGI